MERRDYTITVILSSAITIIIALITWPISKQFYDINSIGYWGLLLLTLFFMNVISIYIYENFFIPKKTTVVVPHVMEAFNEGIIKSKYNFCSTSSKPLALWKSPTFLYYLNTNIVKSITESSKRCNNIEFSDHEEEKNQFFDDGLVLLKKYADNEQNTLAGYYTGIRFLIYSWDVYKKNKEEVRSLINVNALGRIHCIPIIREKLINCLSEDDKGKLGSLSKKLNQNVDDEIHDISKFEKFIRRFNDNLYNFSIPDFLIIDSVGSSTAKSMWWYEKDEVRTSSTNEIIGLGQQCFNLIAKHASQNEILWEEFTYGIFVYVPVIKTYTETDFFSKGYYDNWIKNVVPNNSQLSYWLIKREDEYLRQLIDREKKNINIALDIGCGRGRHLQVLLEKDVKFCAGVDISPTAIRKANSLYSSYGHERLLLKLEDASKTTFNSNYFDLIICMANSFGNMEQDIRENVISEVFRLLKPNGIFILSIYKNHPDTKRIRDLSYIKVGLTPIFEPDPTVIRTQEGLYSKEFTDEEIKYYLANFKDVSLSEIKSLAVIIRAKKP